VGDDADRLPQLGCLRYAWQGFASVPVHLDLTNIGGIANDAAHILPLPSEDGNMSSSTLLYMVLASSASFGVGYIVAWALDEMRVRN
jgi:hypothetical protein